jgi:hypothetical protein
MVKPGLWDGVAISASGLCLVHCLALPVASAALPILGVAADAEWIHWLFLAIAAPAALFAFRHGTGASTWAMRGLAALGVGLLLLGALGWPDHEWETGWTVAGGSALIIAHLWNFRRRRHSH